MTPASTVFIARHGERIDRVDMAWANTAQTPYDPFLTEKGIKQAHALGHHLKTRGLTHIFASPFYRTVQTAHQVAQQTGLPIYIEPGLGEYLHPEWFVSQPELKSAEELKKDFEAVDTSYIPQIFGVYPESRDDVIVRAGCVARLLASQFSGNILLVGHGMTCEFMARGLTNAGRRPYISYCSLQTCTLRLEQGMLYDVDETIAIGFMDEAIRPIVKQIE